MSQFIVETLVFHTKLTFDFKHIATDSQRAIQQQLDVYSRKGYKLISTNATNFGLALYIYLYFEKI